MVISMNSGALDLKMRRKVSLAGAGAGSGDREFGDQFKELGASVGLEAAGSERSVAKISSVVAALRTSFEWTRPIAVRCLPPEFSFLSQRKLTASGAAHERGWPSV